MLVVIAGSAGLLLTLAVAADAGPSWYLQGELGLNLAPGLSLSTGDNDRASRCDEFVNPQYASLDGCLSPNRRTAAVDEWGSRFSRASGLLAGTALGRRVGQRLRGELEYFFRESPYDETVPILSPDGPPYTEVLGLELPRAEERIGSASSHGLFANLYYDFPPQGRFAPFVGLGVGAGFTAVEYGVLWMRDLNPAFIKSAHGLPNQTEVQQNLAGSVTVAHARLQDSLFGGQFIAGASYPLDARLALSIKGRWVGLSAFEDGGAYAALRSHLSHLRRDLSEPVTYRVKIEDTGFLLLSLGLTYELGQRR